MAHIPVSKETLGKKRLKPLANFNFLAEQPVVEVVMGEFSSVAAVYPIFFIERDGVLSPVALMSLISGQNIFVESDGAWSGYYLPAAFRRYPFIVGAGQVEGKPAPILMVEEAMLSDSEGEPLYPEDSKAEADGPIARTLRLIAETDRHHQGTAMLVGQLKEAGLIRPSDLEVNLTGQKHNITGLLGIDEKKLNELSDEKFLELRKSGALSLAYMQLLSVGQVQRLVVRHNLRDAKNRGETTRIIAD
jgi:hypothetical protein